MPRRPNNVGKAIKQVLAAASVLESFALRAAIAHPPLARLGALQPREAPNLVHKLVSRRQALIVAFLNPSRLRNRRFPILSHHASGTRFQRVSAIREDDHTGLVKGPRRPEEDGLAPNLIGARICL